MSCCHMVVSPSSDTWDTCPNAFNKRVEKESAHRIKRVLNFCGLFSYCPFYQKALVTQFGDIY